MKYNASDLSFADYYYTYKIAHRKFKVMIAGHRSGVLYSINDNYYDLVTGLLVDKENIYSLKSFPDFGESLTQDKIKYIFKKLEDYDDHYEAKEEIVESTIIPKDFPIEVTFKPSESSRKYAELYDNYIDNKTSAKIKKIGKKLIQKRS